MFIRTYPDRAAGRRAGECRRGRGCGHACTGGYLNIIAAIGDAARKEMIAAARSFERDNLLRANKAVATIVSIRNGVLVFASVMLVGLVAGGLGKATTNEKLVFASKIEILMTLAAAASSPNLFTTVNQQLPVATGSAQSADHVRIGIPQTDRASTDEH